MKFAPLLFMFFLVAASHCGVTPPDDAKNDGATLCQKIEACPDVDLTVSVEECGRQFDRELAAVSKECKSCVDAITCAGWKQVRDAVVTISGLCPACPATLD
jgi:hypothetical protein